MAKHFIMALDQGTTGTTCLIFDEAMQTVSRAYKEISCAFPHPGWVSQDPEEMWSSCLTVMRKALEQSGLEARQIAAFGLTNQRETTMIWERSTGRPVYDAIVWQCRRSAPIIEQWLQDNPQLGAEISQRTGLIADAYFSASKIAFILNEQPELRARAEAGELAFGTVDTWILWHLTGGRVHATEPSNAARTMLYNIHSLQWDDYLLKSFKVPRALLPDVKPTASLFGVCLPEILGAEIPVSGIAGDQQAALFGQGCFESGDIKNTYGTGCFLVMNTGNSPVESHNRLLQTVAWQIDGQVNYALEGSVFSAGSAVQWLRDGLGVIRSAAETEELAASLADNGGVYFVPAFSGLGAPYWDPYARGTLTGLTRDVGPAHLARAVLEASAYQTLDLVNAMTQDSGLAVKRLRVDGGMTANNFLLQFQADLLNAEVERPKNVDSTALGAAALAGLTIGLFDKAGLGRLRCVDALFKPKMSEQVRRRYCAGWQQAINRTLSVKN